MLIYPLPLSTFLARAGFIARVSPRCNRDFAPADHALRGTATTHSHAMNVGAVTSPTRVIPYFVPLHFSRSCVGLKPWILWTMIRNQSSPIPPVAWVFGIAAPIFLLTTFSQPAYALPSYARQTGYACSKCHTTPPELTQEGRDFKLNGYTLKLVQTITAPSTKKSSPLDMLANLPLSAWFETSYTSTNAPQPGTQNGNFEFPQDISLFLAGAWSSHVGSFLQVTYNTQNDHFSMDNTDIRYANHTTLFDKDLHYGITLNNNPTLEDLWNSTPAWGFPFISTEVAPTPLAAAVINGQLAQDVAGLGAYGLWSNHWYLATTVYRSEHVGGPQPPVGTNFDFNIQGVAPYWRVAWQHPSKNNYLEVGTYGIHLVSTPNNIVGPKNSFTDTAADFQYDRTLPAIRNDVLCENPPCSDALSVRGTYIHEDSALNGSFDAGSASEINHHLDTVEANTEYHFGNRVSFAVGWFRTTGTLDSLLYPEAPVTGSANGNPKANGYILNLSWWPVMNIQLAAQYTGYLQFNGAATNYDGNGRNADANNSIYLLARFMF
jgi:hypothetical protein